MLKLHNSWLVMGVFLLLLSAGVIAQESTGRGMSAGAAVEEIVVSARKRDESLQEVPIAVDVLDADAIEKLNIRDVADVSKYSPSVVFDQGFSAQDTRITIRGLAPTRGRQNVAILVDGIDVTGQAVQTNGGSLLINTRLIDIERVEVLKGPQNALYGRTAFAGAINYITKNPATDSLDAQLYTDLGDNGRYEGRLSLSGPLVTNHLYAGINVASWTDDGFYRNSITGAEVGGREGSGISGNLVWDLSEGFSIKLRAEYTDEDIEQSPYSAIRPTTPVTIPGQAFITPPGGNAPVLSPDAPRAINSVIGSLPAGDSLATTLSPNPRTLEDYPGVEREILRGSLILDYDFGPIKLVSLSGATDADVFSFEDARREGSVIGSNVGGEFWAEDGTEQFSQELRLQSNNDSAVSWTVGALYWEEDVEFVDGGVNCILAPAPGDCAPAIAATTGAARVADLWTRDTEHWSVYGLIDWEFAEAWSLSLEGRYVDEELTVTGPDRAGTPSPFDDRPRAIGPAFGQAALQPSYGTISDTVKDDFFAPKATLRWTPTDTDMYYFSVARAYKPAGVAIVAALTGFNPAVSQFEQEELTAYELGAKTNRLNNQLVLNGALFYQDFSDKQVSTQKVVGGSLLPVPVNASSADIIGLELESRWQATENLDLYAAYTYLYSDYGSFKTDSTGAGSISRAGNCDVFVETTGAGPRSVCSLDLSGNELEFVPEHSLLAGLEYRGNLTSEIDWFAGADYIFQDERALNPENSIKLESYDTLDIRAGLTADSWDLTAYVTNTLDDDTIRSSFGNTDNRQLAVYGPPVTANGPFTFWLPSNQTPIKPNGREIGLRAAYRFGN